MEKKIRIGMIGIVVVFILAACQAANGATPAANSGQSAGQFGPNPAMQTQVASNPDMQTQIASGVIPGPVRASATPTLVPTASPAVESTTSAVSPTAGAVQAAQDYFAALQNGDFTAASKLVSAFSLRTGKLTEGDVADALTQEKSQGAAWSDLQVVDSQVFNDNTILVHVRYQLSSLDAKTSKTVQSEVEEQWPFRLENRKWLYNWTNIIDFKTLSADARLVNGLSVKPLQLTRYSDKIRLTLLAQNGTDQAIVIGQSNQTLAAFHFAEKSVNAENARIYLDAYRSYPSVTIDVKGLFTSYPDSVEMVKYTTTSAVPWFTFALGD
jgi:hypothetical protein